MRGAHELAQRAAPFFELAGLPKTDPEAISSVHTRSVCRLWAGMGEVVELELACPPEHHREPVSIIAKCVKWKAEQAAGGLSIGDRRKRDSYVNEANFYKNGHAQRLHAAGCKLPRALTSEHRPDGITIVMTKLQGRPAAGLNENESRAVLSWLARMHAEYWGARADAAVCASTSGGLQEQGCYWHLDTRPDEHAAMPRHGWEGRLRLAARAVDLRLKEDRMQTVCHGDAKESNIFFDEGSQAPELYDFQYSGKAPPTKDLAYFLTCGSSVDEDRTSSCITPLVRHYHTELSCQLRSRGDEPPSLDALGDSLDLAACDLGRWMSGWGWWGHDLQPWILRVLRRLDGGKALASEEHYVDAVRREFPA